MINKEDCTSIEFEKDTLGGRTFYVRHPKWDNEERAICFRMTRDVPGYTQLKTGTYCERVAGHGTDHVGQGACKTHGGMNHAVVRGKAGIVNGNRSDMSRKHVSYRIKEFIDNDKAGLMDLTYELGAMRVLFQDVIDMFPDADSKEFGGYVARATGMVQAIGSLVDKISKVESRNTITANQVLYLRATIADIFIKHLKDPRDRELAIQDLIMRMPGGNTGGLFNGEDNDVVQPMIGAGEDVR